MTMVTNTPLKNCLKKFCLDTQSSNTNMRLCLSVVTALQRSPRSICKSEATEKSIRTSVRSRQRVWRVSVQTMVRMPHRWVYSQMSTTVPAAVTTNGMP